MSDVVVRISADNEDLKRKLTEAEAKLKSFSNDSARASGGVDKLGGSTKRATSQLGAFASKMAGGLGIGLAISGLKAFQDIAESSMRAARKEAALTQAAFQSALNSTIGVNVPTSSFELTSRDQAVNLGRQAQARLSDVTKEIESSLLGISNQFPSIGGKIETVFETLAALGSDSAENELRRLRALQSQQAELQSQVDFYKTIEKTITNSSRLAAQLSGAGLRDKDALAAPPGPPLAAGLLADLARKPKVPGFGPLPSSGGDVFQEDTFDRITLELLTLQRAVDSGVTPAVDGMRQEASLLQEQLVNMLATGVTPANEQFQSMLQRLTEVRGQMNTTTKEISGGAVALKLLGTIGAGVLSGLIFKFEEANSKAAKLRNTLRGIGQQLFNTLVSAGLNVGIGALTGNPISFGQGLAAAVGLPTSTTTPAAVPSASSASAGLRSQPIPLQVQALRVSGGDLLLTLQEAQNARGGGAISLK